MFPNIVEHISIVRFCGETQYKLAWRNICRKLAYAFAVYAYLKPRMTDKPHWQLV